MISPIMDFLNRVGPVLCIDIGSGTQDMLLARPDLEPENWTQLVLPSPAKEIARQVEDASRKRCNIWLYGDNMGGGFSNALRNHVKQGLKVSVTRNASKAIHDNEENIIKQGFEFSEECPRDAIPIHLTDYSAEYWHLLLSQLHLPYPSLVIAAAQDHGFSLNGNRNVRMKHWKNLLDTSTRPSDWIYDRCVPQELTRLEALRRATGGWVADTGTAVILGGLCSEEVAQRNARQGVTLVNVGNGHTVAALLFRNEVLGIFEHHTGMRTYDEYLSDLQDFQLFWLPDEAVKQTGGHGTAFAAPCEEAGGYVPTFILGPKRQFLRARGKDIAPFGNMMLAGCYGLLYGASQRII